MHRLPFPRRAAWLLVSVLVVAVFNGAAARAGAALSKPTYAAGDHWVYVLDGSLDGFPNLNSSQTGAFHFDLVGHVEVNVLGPSSVLSGSVPIPVVAVDTIASGFLNGTFAVPGIGTAHVTGTFTTRTSEIWEDGAYLPIRSNTTTSYLADSEFGESNRCLLLLAPRGPVPGERHSRCGDLHRVQAESDGREFPRHRRHFRWKQRDRLLLE